MKSPFVRIWFIWLLIGAILLPLPGVASDGGWQLFGKKDKRKEAPLKKAEKKLVKEGTNIKKLPPKSVVTGRKKIESVIPVRRLPGGWVFRDELLAPWSTSLPAVLSIVPDTTVEVIYSDESRTTKDGIVLPI